MVFRKGYSVVSVGCLSNSSTNTSTIKFRLVESDSRPDTSTAMSPSRTNEALISGNGHAGHAEKKKKKRSIGSHVDRQEPNTLTRTDYSRWRLLDDRGRQTWEYLETDKAVREWPQSTADKYFLGLPTVCNPFWIH